MIIKHKEKPKLGDKREIKRFAFLPVKIGDTTLFLEFYTVEQEYKDYRTAHFGFDDIYYKYHTGWQTIAKYYYS